MSSLRVSWEFYHAARDSLLLYEAIVPVKVSMRVLTVMDYARCTYIFQTFIFRLATKLKFSIFALPSCYSYDFHHLEVSLTRALQLALFLVGAALQIHDKYLMA